MVMPVGNDKVLDGHDPRLVEGRVNFNLFVDETAD